MRDATINETTGKQALDTNRRKATLEAKMRELLGTSFRREDVQVEYEADPLDQIKSNVDREISMQHLNLHARQVHDIQAALDAIEDHTYGVCENCEEPIPSKRLDAVPWARLCVKCKSAEEAGSHEEEVLFSQAA